MRQGELRAVAAADQEVDSASTVTIDHVSFNLYPVVRIPWRKLYKQKTADEVQHLEKQPLLHAYSRLYDHSEIISKLLNQHKLNNRWNARHYSIKSRDLNALTAKYQASQEALEDLRIALNTEVATSTAFRNALEKEFDVNSIVRGDLEDVKTELSNCFRSIAKQEKDIGDLQHEVNTAYAQQQQAINNLGYVQEELNTKCVELSSERASHRSLQQQFSSLQCAKHVVDSGLTGAIKELQEERAQAAQLQAEYNAYKYNTELEITRLRQEVRYLQLQQQASPAQEQANQAEEEELLEFAKAQAYPWGEPEYQPA